MEAISLPANVYTINITFVAQYPDEKGLQKTAIDRNTLQNMHQTRARVYFIIRCSLVHFVIDNDMNINDGPGNEEPKDTEYNHGASDLGNLESIYLMWFLKVGNPVWNLDHSNLKVRIH